MTLDPTRKPDQPFSAAPLQTWSAQQVRTQQEEALYAFGELCLFTLMWRSFDFDAGLVDHCATCYYGNENRQARAWQQPTRNECPDCFGTTFAGGFRAQIIRPTLISDRNPEVLDESRGETISETLSLETTGDFTMHQGDYVFRFDDTRYQAEEKRSGAIRPGFAPNRIQDAIAAQTSVHREPPNGRAYLIPPTAAALVSMLGVAGPFLVSSLTASDYLAPNGYLL